MIPTIKSFAGIPRRESSLEFVMAESKYTPLASDSDCDSEHIDLEKEAAASETSSEDASSKDGQKTFTWMCLNTVATVGIVSYSFLLSCSKLTGLSRSLQTNSSSAARVFDSVSSPLQPFISSSRPSHYMSSLDLPLAPLLSSAHQSAH